jgi:hypothetical protein
VNFQQVVAGIVSGGQANLEMRSCPDQIYGKIERNGNTFVVRESRKDITERNGQPAIIIVLESPHTKEFENEKIEPAKGDTGDNIKDYLLKRFSSYLNGHLMDGTEIILVNSIQYQCSLGVDTKAFRDKVFTAIWNDFGNECFICRLTHIYWEGDYLINACTKGNNDISQDDELRRLVENAINAIEDSPLIKSDLHTMHPSNWDKDGKEDRNKNCGWLWGESKERRSQLLARQRREKHDVIRKPRNNRTDKV